MATRWGRYVPEAQFGVQLSMKRVPCPVAVASLHVIQRMCPRRPAFASGLVRPGPPMKNWPQQPKESVAGRTAKFMVTSARSNRGVFAEATAEALDPTSRLTLAPNVKIAPYQVNAPTGRTVAPTGRIGFAWQPAVRLPNARLRGLDRRPGAGLASGTIRRRAGAERCTRHSDRVGSARGGARSTAAQTRRDLGGGR
jgi:hypothetical protein